jgi:bis(5'-nucleosyl)-tetraphosphatase (symmetrical)
MARYAIGDIHGNYDTFQRLLKRIGFQPQRDTLFLLGDLVGRGTDGEKVLQYAYDHQESVLVLLGNHEINLLAAAVGVWAKPSWPIAKILNHSAARTWIEFVRQQPLVRDLEHVTLVHAGILPRWQHAEILRQAYNAQHWLSGTEKELKMICQTISIGRKYPFCYAPHAFASRLDKAAFAITVLTTIRCLSRQEKLLMRFKNSLEKCPLGYYAWFQHPYFAPKKPLVFGHWAALGHSHYPQAICLDSGCGWNRSLTAWDLDHYHSWNEPCR